MVEERNVPPWVRGGQLLVGSEERAKGSGEGQLDAEECQVPDLDLREASDTECSDPEASDAEIPDADSLEGEVPDFDEAIAAESAYWRDLAKPLIAMVVIGILIAAAAFRWIPTSEVPGSGPILLSPSLTATALAIIAALVAALQVAARQPAVLDRETEHLGRISGIETLARLAGLGAIILVASDIPRIFSNGPYVTIVVLELGTGVLVAAIAADANLATTRRYGKEFRDSRARGVTAAIDAALRSLEGQELANQKSRRPGVWIDTAAASGTMVVIALTASLVGPGNFWVLLAVTAVLAGTSFAAWACVRVGFMSHERAEASFIGLFFFLFVALYMLVLLESVVDGVDEPSAWARKAIMIAILLGSPVPALWAHRSARDGRMSLGDRLVIWGLKRRRAGADTSAPSRTVAWRGWTSIAMAVLLPPIGVPWSLLVERGVGVQSGGRDGRIARWGWLAGLTSFLAWAGLALTLWLRYE